MPTRRVCLLALCCWLTTASGALADRWVAVVAPGLRDTIKPLADYHREAGLDVVVLDYGEIAAVAGDKPAEALRERLRATCGSEKTTSYVLLVGSAVSNGAVDEPFVVPALPGTTARMMGQPTDNGYGCFDESRLPSVAVGRFPARSVAEARAMVAKTLRWERDRRPGQWKRRITVLAGAPSYNRMADAMAERMAMSNLARVGPAWTARAIYRNPNSPFTLPDDDLREQALAYVRGGQALTVFLGHSGAEGFWHRWQTHDNELVYAPTFGADDWASLRIPRGSGIFATFGCFGAQLRGRGGEGYGLYAMRNPHGPVAVLAYRGECWAAMSMLSAQGLLSAMPDSTDAPRLATLLTAAKRSLAKGVMNPLVYRMLDAVDGDPDTPQATQRIEHLEMLLLLGDPALRLPAFTHALSLDVQGHATAGATLTIRGHAPPALVGAKGRVTIERALTSKPARLERLSSKLPVDRQRELARINHRRSNQFVVAQSDIVLIQPSFETKLELPDKLPWPDLVVRVYVATDTADAQGVQPIETVNKPTPDEPNADRD